MFVIIVIAIIIAILIIAILIIPIILIAIIIAFPFPVFSSTNNLLIRDQRDL